MAKTLILLLCEGLSSSRFTKFGFGIYRCLSLNITILLSKGEAERGTDFNSLVSVKKYTCCDLHGILGKIGQSQCPAYQNSNTCLSVIKVTSPNILVGILGKCGNTGKYGRGADKSYLSCMFHTFPLT